MEETLDWIQLIPHGVAHLPSEFQNVYKDDLPLVFNAINEFFTDDKLPYEKGFKAPQWLYTQDLVDFLDEKGWWMAVDRNQPNAPRTKRFYEYNYSIEEKFWESKEPIWKLHGHMGAPSTNNIEDCFLNLLKIPSSEWHYVKLIQRAKIVYSPMARLKDMPRVRQYWQQFGKVTTGEEKERLVVYIKHEDKSLS